MTCAIVVDEIEAEPELEVAATYLMAAWRTNVAWRVLALFVSWAVVETDVYEITPLPSCLS